jgi:FHS family L-fucose permease-like MFS transporter
MQRDERESVAKYGAAVTITVMALALWGFGHRLYATLLPDLAGAMALSPAKTDMAKAAVAIGYFVMALPTAFVSRNFGYKVAALLGLGTFAVGMFLFRPAVEQHSFLFIVLAAVVIGAGLAIVQISTALMMLCLGPKESAIRRMNLAQAFTPLGSLCGLVLGQTILQDVLHKNSDEISRALMLPLSAVGIVAIALAFVLEIVHFPTAASTRVARTDSTWKSFLPPLRIPHFRYAMAAQFLSLLAQVILAAFAVRYCLSAMPSWTPQVTQQWFVNGMIAFAVGRFVGTGLMIWFDPMKLLVVFSAISALCTAVAVLAPGVIGVISLVAAAFFISIQLPTIFAAAVRDLGEMTKSGAAILMFVAFSGTGFIGLVALLTTAQTVHSIMTLPALCLAGVTICAARMSTPAARVPHAPKNT